MDEKEVLHFELTFAYGCQLFIFLCWVMFRAIAIFLLFQLGYHLLVTFLGYGAGWIDQSLLAMLRDGVRVSLCAVLFLFNYPYRKAYFQQWGKLWLALCGLLGFGVLTSFFLFHKLPSELLIGIKYGLWWLIILLSATGLGFFWQKREKSQTSFSSFSRVLKWSLVVVLILGRIWQLGKLAFPDPFFAFGYGNLDDFHFGANPPIYYLTGFEGTLRWQGLFAGPNNYGYFLVLFLPLILYFFPLKKQESWLGFAKKNCFSLLVITFWLMTLGATLSRSALIGAFIVLILSQFSFLKQHKKMLFGFLVIAFLSLVGFSFLKRDSTKLHLSAKVGGLLQVIDHPLGYGLGSSGPAVHHGGSHLPENYYLQLMLDLGTVGFLLWCGVMFLLGLKQKKLQQSLAENRDTEEGKFFLALQKGFLVFLVMGLFLHVFEDSMVNYLFFVLYGMSLGILSALVPSNQACGSSSKY